MYILINTNDSNFPSIVTPSTSTIPMKFKTEEEAAEYGNAFVGLYIIVKID
jgi:hypothetical protein